jgi:type IV pilus assembly protein PilW
MNPTLALRIRAQRGLTIVELMVAVALGMLLMLVVAQAFLATKGALRTQESLGRVQENARFATALLSREIRMAGYRADPSQGIAVVYPAATTQSTCTGGRPAICGLDGGGSASDTLTLRFQGSGPSAGNADGRIIDYIANDPGNNNEPTLYCSTTANASTAAAGTPIIAGAENMQILYGEDVNGDRSPDRYVTANNVSNMDSVVAIRISLLMRTDVMAGVGVDTKTYSLVGTTVNPADENRIRRVFTMVVNLRNRTS